MRPTVSGPVRRAIGGAALPVLGGLVLLAATGCSRWEALGEPPPPPAPTRWEQALVLLDEEAWSPAEARLREIAERCEDPGRARDAALLLSVVHLDPRNPAARPDTAALMAMRLLKMPGTTADQRALSEGLYLLALGRGADPALRPLPAGTVDAPASRFTSCGAAPPDSVGFPVLDAAARARLMGAPVEGGAGGGGPAAAELLSRNAALQQRVAELEAELQRIRRILGGGADTTGSRPR